MSTYEPGTVAVATVRGVPNVRVMRYTPISGDAWISGDRIRDNIAHPDTHVSDVRPLVVLDVPAMVVPHKMAEALRKYDFLWLADQIEAQTKPPRIPEPKGLGAVVEDTNGRRWVRIDDDPELNKPWRPSDMAAIRCHWRLVDAARVLSEGVTS